MFFGLAVSLLAAVAVWLGTLAVRGLAASPETSRRARRGAALAGGAVGLACLVYLTLWWRTATAFGTASPWWALLALGVAAAISVLLGHAVAVTVLALLARRGLAASLQRGTPLSSPKVTFPLGAERVRRRHRVAFRQRARELTRAGAPVDGGADGTARDRARR